MSTIIAKNPLSETFAHQSSITKKLPKDLLLTCCSFLSIQNTKNLVYTCREYRSLADATAQMHRHSLRQVTKKIYLLLHIKEPNIENILERSSLKTMDRAVLKISGLFLKTFIDYPEECVNLKSKALPLYVHRVIETSKNVNEALKISDKTERTYALQTISEKLTADLRTPEAFEVVGRIPDEFIKHYAMMNVLKSLIDRGHIEEAFEAIEKIPSIVMRSIARRDSIKFLATTGHAEKASEINLIRHSSSDKCI